MLPYSSTPWTARPRRRVAALVAAFVVLAAMALSACGGSSSGSGSTTGAADRVQAVSGQQGTLHVGLSYVRSPNLDPIRGDSEPTLIKPLYDWIVGTTPDGTAIAPTGIATSWQEAPDHMSWTLKIRRGVPWQKGNGTVSAADVAFTINRLTGPLMATQSVSFWKTHIKDAQVVDPQTVRITLSSPAWNLPYMLSPLNGGDGAVIPQKYFQRVGAEGFSRNPVGSGPYEYVSQSTDQYVFRALPSHWRLGVPRYRELVVSVVPEATTRLAELQRGALDLIDVPLNLVGQVDPNQFVIEAKRDHNNGLNFPSQFKPGPLHDANVRKALALSVDRRALAELMGAKYRLAEVDTHLDWCSDWMPPCQGVRPDLLRYDPAQARKLLAAAHLPSDFEVQIFTYNSFPEQADMSEAVAAYFEAVGVRAKVVPIDVARFRANAGSGGFPANAAFINVGASQGDSTSIATAVFERRGGFHFADSPQLEPVMRRMGAALTEQDWAAAVKQYEQIVADNYMESPMVHSGRIIAFNPKKVVDRTLGGHMINDFGIWEVLSNSK